MAGARNGGCVFAAINGRRTERGMCVRGHKWPAHGTRSGLKPVVYAHGPANVALVVGVAREPLVQFQHHPLESLTFRVQRLRQ